MMVEVNVRVKTSEDGGGDGIGSFPTRRRWPWKDSGGSGFGLVSWREAEVPFTSCLLHTLACSAESRRWMGEWVNERVLRQRPSAPISH